MKKILNRYGFEIILGLLITTYIIIFSLLSIKRYQTLNSHYYDLGIMNQVVYNTSQGKFLEMTDQDSAKNLNRIAIHFDPILAIFAPLYKIYSGPETLLISQAIVLGFGALAVYLIAAKILKKKWLALLFSIIYLLYFPVERANLFDFHAVTLATTFLLFTFYFLLENRYFWFFVFLILSLLCKEHVGLLVMFLGIYIYFLRKNKKLGIIVFMIGLTFFIVAVFILIPYFRLGEHFALKYYQGNLLGKLLNKNTLIYGLQLIVPMFLTVLSPITLLMAAPEVAINIFSFNNNMEQIYFHYNSLIVPVLIFSSILGYKFIDDRIKNKLIKNLILIIFILLNIISVYLYDPWPVKFVAQPVFYHLNQIKAKDLKTIYKWKVKLADGNIKLATTPVLAPFFTERTHFYNFLYDPTYASQGFTDEYILANKINNYMFADYVIIDKQEIGDVNIRTLPVKFYQNFRQDKHYQMIYSDNSNIEVYKKIR